MNLLVEYCRRHQEEWIWADEAGVVFFDREDHPSTIMLTSSHPKQTIVCRSCTQTAARTHNKVAVELFDHIHGVHCIKHAHIPSETNLIEWLSECNGSMGKNRSAFKPFYAHTNQDVESWLWRFFLRSYKTRVLLCKDFIAKRPRTVLECREQMVKCAIEKPRIFQYYFNMWQKFTVGRHYLLYE